MTKIYNWEGTPEHKAVIAETARAKGDVHGAVAAKFDIDRQAAKLANYRLQFGNES